MVTIHITAEQFLDLVGCSQDITRWALEHGIERPSYSRVFSHGGNNQMVAIFEDDTAATLFKLRWL